MRFVGCTINQFWDTIKIGPPLQNIKKREVIKEISEYERIVHVMVKPPIMTTREQVVNIKREDLDDGSTLVILHSIETDLVPLKSDVVRAQMYKGMLLRQAEDNPKDLLWTDISQFDMKGNVPARFINMMITTMVAKGAQNIYDEMQKH